MKKQFKENGFIKMKLNAKHFTSTISNDLGIIADNFDSLPKDVYSDIKSNRFRAYSNAIIIPWERKITWIPNKIIDGQYTSSYWQGGFNPEHTNNIRYFTPINHTTLDTRFITNLIMHDFDLTFWQENNNLPIYVGVHFIKLMVMNKTDIAISSPDLMHRDGEAFTFAHLFNRSNIKGGINYIANPEYANYKINNIPDNNILSQFELQDKMEGYAVCDDMVSHYVSPIEIQDEELQYGSREIILIDFSHLNQKLRLE